MSAEHTPSLPYLMDMARQRGDSYALKIAADEIDKFRSDPIVAAAPDLLAACVAQHDAIDTLFAMLIERDRTFFPTKSGVWGACVQGHAAIAKASGTAA